MYVPSARERVEVIERSGVFLVLWVDRDEGSAELVSIDDRVYQAESVPFELLRPIKQDKAPDSSTEIHS